jgi:hypothetical protein
MSYFYTTLKIKCIAIFLELKQPSGWVLLPRVANDRESTPVVGMSEVFVSLVG